MKLFFLSLLSVLVVNTVTNPFLTAQPLKSGTNERSLLLQGMTRTFRAYLPKAVNISAESPVVLVLHGFGGNAKNALKQGKWEAKAEKEGFIVVGLDGTLDNLKLPYLSFANPRSWAAGGGSTKADERGVDDVAFAAAVIDSLITWRCANPKRIYATGFSNGAGMTWRIGAVLSDRIAAIAPVANSLLVNVEKLSRPLPLLLIWGTADPVNPMAGGMVPRSGKQEYRPAAESVWRSWATMLGCTGEAQTLLSQNGVKTRAFKNCTGKAEATFITIEGMGHTWAGGVEFLPERIVGKTSNALDATDTIWAFFSQYSLP